MNFTAPIEEYWSALLGCDVEYLNQAGIVLVPRLLDHDYEGYYLFRRGEGIVISIMSKQPASLYHRLEETIRTAKPADVFARAFWESNFENDYQRLVGPAVVSYANSSEFKPVNQSSVRKLSPQSRDDAAALRRLFGECSIEEWEHSGIQFDHDPIFGASDGAQLVAACSYELWTTKIAHLGVAVSTEQRGKGHGTAAVSAAAAHCLENTLVPQYRALASNLPSVKIGRRLGFVEYAQTLSVTIHDPD